MIDKKNLGNKNCNEGAFLKEKTKFNIISGEYGKEEKGDILEEIVKKTREDAVDRIEKHDEKDKIKALPDDNICSMRERQKDDILVKNPTNEGGGCVQKKSVDREISELSVSGCGWERCRPNHMSGPIMRDYYVLFFFVSGSGDFVVNDISYHLEKNQGILISPSLTSDYTANPNDPGQYYWVGINGVAVIKMLETFGLIESVNIINFNEPEKIKQYLKNINSYSGQDDASVFGMRGNLYLIFSCMLNSYDEKHINVLKSENESYISKALRFIDENYCTGITVTDIAKYVGFERTYFYKLFKQNMGVSPKDYLTNKRMNKVMALMKTSSFSLNQISKMVGYEDYSNFFRIFNKHFGKSPNNYKENRFWQEC